MPAVQEIQLTPPQSTIFLCDKRFRVLAAGRRFGKTHLIVPELIRAAWGEGKIAWYIAPTYKQAKMIAWDKLKSMCHPWFGQKPNETELSVRLVNGGQIRLHGAERYDALRGPGIDFVAFDEFADIDFRAWTHVIRPMLSDKSRAEKNGPGRAIFVGSPRGRDGLWKLYSKDEMEDPECWGCFQYTTLQGGNVTPEEIEAARANLDERTFRQEFLATFESYSGNAYFAFMRNGNVLPQKYDPNIPLAWSLDFNVTPMTSVIGQIHEHYPPPSGVPFWINSSKPQVVRPSKTIHILDEIWIRDSNTPEASSEFFHRADMLTGGKGCHVWVYGDASGDARQTAGAGSTSDWQAVKAAFRLHPQYRPTFKYKEANPRVRDRVGAVNSLLCNSKDERRLFIDPKCHNLIKDMEQVSWKLGTVQLDEGPDKMLGHCAAGLGYLVDSEMPIRNQGGFVGQRLF